MRFLGRKQYTLIKQHIPHKITSQVFFIIAYSLTVICMLQIAYKVFINRYTKANYCVKDPELLSNIYKVIHYSGTLPN